MTSVSQIRATPRHATLRVQWRWSGNRSQHFLVLRRRQTYSGCVTRLPLLSPVWPAAIVLEGSLALASAAIAVHEAALEAVLQCYCEERADEAARGGGGGGGGGRRGERRDGA